MLYTAIPSLNRNHVFMSNTSFPHITHRASKLCRRRAIMLLLMFWVVATAAASEALDRFVASRAFPENSMALMVVDLLSGKVIDAHNADLPLVPASIMKSVTSATLLNKVGKDYRYATQFFTEGDISQGVLKGNLVIEGACDPSLESDNDPGSSDIVDEIIGALRDAGVKRIEGRIVIDENNFAGPACPPSWMAADLSNSYGTGSHGFNYADNASGKRSVADPSARFLSRLRTALSGAGITVDNDRRDGGRRRKIGEHLSATVDDIMRSCMMRSDNLYAESMLRTYSHATGGDGSTADGATRELDFWRHAKAPLDDVVIVDGSGLSRSNRVTANFMTSVLTAMSGNPYYASFFPLAGEEGTLKRFLADTPLQGYVAMKTGSMNGIQCYAGYKLDDNYVPTHAIVIMVNNLKSRADMRAAAEKYLLETFKTE